MLIVAGALATLTLLPYAWAFATNTVVADWQFMGILANPQDGATYLAKIGQGIRGAWLLQFMHTPELHTGAAMQVFYLFLGHMARLIGVSSLVIFHLARVVTTLFMFIALYQFGATVWTRQRPRRLFLGLVTVGSGLGWLALILGANASDIPDVTVPEAYPLYSAYANPHFPLAIGCLALIAAVFIRVFRIDFAEEPAVNNGGLEVALLTLVTAVVLPQCLIPFGVSLGLYFFVRAWQTRRFPVLELRWIAMMGLPSTLVAAFYVVVLLSNDQVNLLSGQIEALTTSPLLLLLAFGLILVLAVPGLIRALRHFEGDGDRLMLIWLVANFLLVFLPFNHQRRLMTGLIIPVAFFAVRALEDYWLPRLKSRRQMGAFLVALFVLVIPSNVLALGMPLFGIINPQAGLDLRLLVEPGYWEAMNWLADHGQMEDVVLSSSNVSLWIPAWGAKRVVYGHPFETLYPDLRLAQVEAWYQGEDCETLLNDVSFHVRYVLVGPQERAYGEGIEDGDACYADLGEVSRQVVEFADVTLYELAR